MPRLPDQSDIGYVTPQPRGGVASYSGAGLANEEAAKGYGQISDALGQAVGGATKNINSGMQQVEDANDKINYSAAYGTFLTKKLALDQQYANDQEYTTIADRYAKDIQKAAQDSSASIANVAHKAQFVDATNRWQEAGINQMRGVAKAKSVDADRAYVNDFVSNTLDAALRAPDEATRSSLFDSAGNVINGMAQKGSLLQREAVKIRQQLPSMYAKKYFQTLLDSNPALAVKLLDPNAPALPTGLQSDLGAAIHNAADTHGVDADVLSRIAQVESNGRVSAVNPQSGAAGPFQFMPATARAYGVTDPTNPGQASIGAAALLADNKNALNSTLGREPTPAELYMAHQQGATGAAALIQNPEMRAIDVLGKDKILQNGGKANMTAGDFVNMWSDKFNKAPGIPQAQAPQADDKGNVLFPKTGDIRDFLLPNERAQFIREGQQRTDALIRAKDADEQRARRLSMQAIEDGSNAAENKLISDTEGGTNDKVTAAQIADPTGTYKDLTPAAKLRMIAFVNRPNKGEPASAASHALASNLVGDIRNGKVTDLAPIFDAYTKKDADGNPIGLTNGDFNFVRQSFIDMQNPDGQKLGKVAEQFIADHKQAIDKANPLMGQIDMDGGDLLFQLRQNIEGKISAYRKEGKDPYDLFNPSKPDYLGKPEALAPYQKSIPESVQSFAARMRQQSQPRPIPKGAVSVPLAPVARPSLDSIFSK